MEGKIAHYRILRQLGRGAMGEVYLAEDTKLRRRVALKVLPAEMVEQEERLERFRREARIVAALNHPSIVTVYSVDEVDGVHFFTMELVDGETLAQVLEGGGLEADRLFSLAEALVDGLAAAHGKGVTHRDLKPANIMVTRDGRLKILDFGLARMQEPSEVASDSDETTSARTEAGALMGTFHYMSPEQLRGQPADPRSDVFATGIILYEMATGRHPFAADTSAGRIASILRDPPEEISGLALRLPGGFGGLIAHCLEKDPDRRPQSGAELLEELRRAWASETEPRSDAALDSLAVLPLIDLSEERNQEYFCDGITEEIMQALAKVRGLRVAARSSAFRFKGPTVDVKEVGRKLGVSAVLEGSVRKAGDRLRIGVQLVRVADGYNVWTERFDRQLKDVLALQDDIAKRVAESLGVELAGGSDARGPARQALSLDAYNSYLRARHLLNKRTRSTLEESIELFQQVVDVDPAYASAHSGLADAYALLGIYGALPARLAMPRAKAAAERALAIDGLLPEAHVSLACVESLHDRAWADAESRFLRALELDPSSSVGHQWYATQNLLPRGRFGEAMDHLREAERLDPLSPVIHASLGLALYFEERYEEAVARLREVLSLERRFAMARLFLGRALCEMGRHEESLAELERSVELSEGSIEAHAALGNALARAGRQDEAEAIRDRLGEEDGDAYVSPSLIAQIETGLGRLDSAMELLEEGLEERAVDLAWVAVRPVFKGLRGESRFGELVDKLALPPRAERRI